MSLTEKLDAYEHCSGGHPHVFQERHGALTAVTSVRTMGYRLSNVAILIGAVRGFAATATGPGTGPFGAPAD